VIPSRKITCTGELWVHLTRYVYGINTLLDTGTHYFYGSIRCSYGILYGLNTYSPYIYGPKRTGTESVVLQRAPSFLRPFLITVTVYVRTVTVIKALYSCATYVSSLAVLPDMRILAHTRTGYPIHVWDNIMSHTHMGVPHEYNA